MKMRYIFALLAAWLGFNSAIGVDFNKVRFHNEASDTTRIAELLVDVAGMKLKGSGDVVAELGRRMVGVPYVGHTLEGEPEMLTVNLDELDCTTYVETVLALALTIDERRTAWRDFVYNLERIRYRQGHLDGYPSRLHYNCDWAVDNIHRGNIVDATTLFPRYTYATKTIDFMTQNADKYPALADSANFARIKDIERGYYSHRYPYIKSIDTGKKETVAKLRNGDIVAFVSNLKNLDVTHMGIIVMEDGEPHVMHASSSEGKVLVSKLPLADFLKKNRQFLGIRVYRINQN